MHTIIQFNFLKAARLSVYAVMSFAGLDQGILFRIGIDELLERLPQFLI